MANLSFSNPDWNPTNTGGAGLSYADYGVPSVWDMATSSLPLDMGTPFNPGASGGVNTTQIDGQAGFFEGLAGFGQALLQGIGVRPEPQAQAQVMPASWFGRQEPKGLEVEQIAIFGLLAVGIYFAFK